MNAVFSPFPFLLRANFKTPVSPSNMIDVVIICIIVGVFFVFVVALWRCGCFRDFKDIYTYNDRPGLLCIFAKGLILSLKRKQGRLYPGDGKFGLRLSSVGSKDSTSRSVVSTGNRPKYANITFNDCRCVGINDNSFLLYNIWYIKKNKQTMISVKL